MTRLRFILIIGGCAFGVAVIVSFVTGFLNSRLIFWSVLGETLAWLVLPATLAAVIVAALLYKKVNIELSKGKYPWALCLIIITLSYPLFGCFSTLIGMYMFPNNFPMTPEGFALGAIVWTTISFMATCWFTFPLALFIAKIIQNSNKRMQSDPAELGR